jgi:hypothetical protein
MGPMGQPLLATRFPTALKIASTLFIQVGLIRGSRIDATPYIYSLVPPPWSHPETLIHILLIRIRVSYQEKISPP